MLEEYGQHVLQLLGPVYVERCASVVPRYDGLVSHFVAVGHEIVHLSWESLARALPSSFLCFVSSAIAFC